MRVHGYRQVVADGPSRCVLVPVGVDFAGVLPGLPAPLCEHPLWFREQSFELGDAWVADVDWAAVAGDIAVAGFHVITSWPEPRLVAEAYELWEQAWAVKRACWDRCMELLDRLYGAEGDARVVAALERPEVEAELARARAAEDEAYERWVGLVEACDAASEPDPA